MRPNYRARWRKTHGEKIAYWQESEAVAHAARLSARWPDRAYVAYSCRWSAIWQNGQCAAPHWHAGRAWPEGRGHMRPAPGAVMAAMAQAAGMKINVSVAVTEMRPPGYRVAAFCTLCDREVINGDCGTRHGWGTAQMQLRQVRR